MSAVQLLDMHDNRWIITLAAAGGAAASTRASAIWYSSGSSQAATSCRCRRAAACSAKICDVAAICCLAFVWVDTKAIQTGFGTDLWSQLLPAALRAAHHNSSTVLQMTLHLRIELALLRQQQLPRTAVRGQP